MNSIRYAEKNPQPITHNSQLVTKGGPIYTKESLLDIHERSHRSLKKLIEHCLELSVDELNREMPGFGYPTVRLLLDHIISAEKYWISVVLSRMDLDEPNYPTIELIEKYRLEVFGVTEEYIRAASPDELNTPRKMITWQNIERTLAPAHVIMRTQTHIYHHQGQILVICRLLEKPAAGLDFPIV